MRHALSSCHSSIPKWPPGMCCLLNLRNTWLLVGFDWNVLLCFALNIALMCNYHRIPWENKVPGWFMLHIFPKPELKPSKPPKVNHQTESASFQKRGEQLRGAVHGSCGKHSPGGGIHPLCSRTTQDLGKGIDYWARIIPALAVLPRVCGQWEFCPCFQHNWNLP